jgi:hypothetical protein
LTREERKEATAERKERRVRAGKAIRDEGEMTKIPLRAAFFLARPACCRFPFLDSSFFFSVLF